VKILVISGIYGCRRQLSDLRHLASAHEVNTALIVQTALIALCNKVITMHLASISWTTVVSVASLILALSAAMFALRKERL